MRIGIDLLWVRPGICGGTESFIRNLLEGFKEFDRENEYFLFAARDNESTFRHYEENGHMSVHVCNVNCNSQPRRILWENIFLDRTARREGIDVMYIPVYSMPRTHGSGIPYVCTIHDVQALHYPQYFSPVKRLFLKQAWHYACRKAGRVVTGSAYCENDLVTFYPTVKDRTEIIYDVVASRESSLDFGSIEAKYGLEQGQYDYCVSSMLPHKNLTTLLRTVELRRRQGKPCTLVLSGVGGRHEDFDAEVERLNIGDIIINTGFVSDEERDCLYDHCRLFLFPSIFEGFGMPPIEAMRRGKRVVMTRESCLEEVTQGKAVYVDSPYDAADWSRKMDIALEERPEIQTFERYEPKNVAAEYIKVFNSLSAKRNGAT